MFDSFALLISDAWIGLGRPNKEHLDPEDLTRAAFQALAFFGLDAQHSEYARSTKSVPLNLNARDAMLSGAPDMMLPSYIERRVGHGQSDGWEWVPLVRHSMLEEGYLDGRAQATIYREQHGWRITLSYDPSGVEHRLRYLTDPVTAGSLDDPLPLPPRFGYMFVAKAILNAVPMMMMTSANLPVEQQLNSAQLSAINTVIAHSQGELGKYEPLWKAEKTATRNPRGGMRSSLVPRGN